MNGAAGVLATVSSVTLAAYVGLTHVVWIGAGCYLLACLLLPGLRATVADLKTDTGAASPGAAT
jgi:hypothetical protein